MNTRTQYLDYHNQCHILLHPTTKKKVGKNKSTSYVADKCWICSLRREGIQPSPHKYLAKSSFFSFSRREACSREATPQGMFCCEWKRSLPFNNIARSHALIHTSLNSTSETTTDLKFDINYFWTVVLQHFVLNVLLDF